VKVAGFYQNSNLLIGAKNPIAGLTLRASDTECRPGDGSEVAGPIAWLAMAMTGRTAALDDLAGDGVDKLRSRR